MPTDLSPPTSLAANETVVIKKRRRIASIIIDRNGANIVFNAEDANIDNSTDEDRKVVPGPLTLRPLTDAVLDSKVGGTGATLRATIGKLGDFYAQFRAEDIAAQTPPP